MGAYNKLKKIVKNRFNDFFSDDVVYIKFLHRDYEENIGLLVGGIDEAGRGPVIGPMVMAGLMIPAVEIAYFLNVDIARDSKELSKNQRLELVSLVVERTSASIYFAVIPPKVIDKWVLNHSLNKLEAKVAMGLIQRYMRSCFVVFIDSPSTSQSFDNYLKDEINWEIPHVIPEVKADKYRIPVSLASSFAKVMRDSIIEEIKEKIGIDFGSGYPSDYRTKRALNQILKMYPWVVRKSWKSVRKMDA